MSHLARTLAITALALTAALSVQAGSQWMTDLQLRENLAGHDLAGHYASGKTFTESYHPDGTLTYRETSRETNGRWSVIAGTFCTIYDSDPTGGCFQVRRESDNCFEFYFIARSEPQAREFSDRTKPAWTARAWLTDKVSTCTEGTSV